MVEHGQLCTQRLGGFAVEPKTAETRSLPGAGDILLVFRTIVEGVRWRPETHKRFTADLIFLINRTAMVACKGRPEG